MIAAHRLARCRGATRLGAGVGTGAGLGGSKMIQVQSKQFTLCTNTLKSNETVPLQRARLYNSSFSRSTLLSSVASGRQASMIHHIYSFPSSSLEGKTLRSFSNQKDSIVSPTLTSTNEAKKPLNQFGNTMNNTSSGANTVRSPYVLPKSCEPFIPTEQAENDNKYSYVNDQHFRPFPFIPSLENYPLKYSKEGHSPFSQTEVQAETQRVMSIFTKHLVRQVLQNHKRRRRRKYNVHPGSTIFDPPFQIERNLTTSTSNSSSSSTSTSASHKEKTSETSPSSESNKENIPPTFDFQNTYAHNHMQTPTNQDEYYNYIELLQRNRTQALRAKTTLNVTRALYGNTVIALAKFGAWASSGSSAMLSEFVHSLVDCGNQALLLLGLRDSGFVADRKHPYGYGKSMYFWALVSALGTFWLGAGISMRHSVEELMYPSLHEITWHVWGVLGLSLAVDGWVLYRTVKGVWETKPESISFYKHLTKLRDPATLAVVLEDSAACLGIIMASAGISLTAATGSPVYDGLAGVGISGLLAGMGLILVRLNQRFLLGQAVDPEIIAGIEKILLTRRSIDGVHSVQSQWTGPDTFSYKAEVDFDGTYLAAKLMPRYQKEFMEAKDTLDQDLHVLLSWYAEDVMRAVEREIRHIEAEVRKEYPGAAFIELEPDSKDADRFAIDDGMEAKLKKIELEVLNRYLKSLYVGGITNTPSQTGKSTKKLDKSSDIDARSLPITKTTSIHSGKFQDDDIKKEK